MAGYLDPGERVQLETRPHPVSLVPALGRALLAAVGGAVLVVAGSPLTWVFGAVGVLALAVSAALAFAAVWRWDATLVVLTTDKLFVVHGVLRRRAAAVRLARVGAVEVRQSLLGRLLGYCTLVAGNLEVPYVADSAGVDRLLR